MSEITKEDLLLIAEMQGKVATQMESIANAIRIVSENNKEIAAIVRDLPAHCLQNRQECIKCLTDTIDKKLDVLTKVPAENKENILKVKDDVFWVKIIIGAIFLVVALALAVQQFVHWLGHVGIK